MSQRCIEKEIENMRFSDLSLGEEIKNTEQYLKLLKKEKNKDRKTTPY